MSQQPNLLLVVVDQQRYDCIGFAGRYPVRTPNIDKLARDGVWFTHAFSHIPLCSPARQSLLNGRRPETFGALWNYDNGLQVSALHPASYAWPRELQEAGYQMGYVGKWNVHPSFDPTAYGYDQYVSHQGYLAFQAEKYSDIHFSGGFFGERNPVAVCDSQTHWLANRAVQMMEEYAERGRPWHVRVDFPEPHLPCRPSAPFSDLYAPSGVPIWHNFQETFQHKPYIQRQQLLNWGIEDFTWDDWAPIVSRYYGMVSQVDDAIGTIVNAVEQLGSADNTIVIFTADHGDLCGAHKMMDKHYVLYDDVVHVPLVIKWPMNIALGQTCHSFVYNLLDLPPTICDLLGLKKHDALQGRSLHPLLFNQPAVNWRDHVVSTYNGQQFGLYTQRMLRTTRYKYVWNTTDVDEFYDLDTDPGELVNAIYEPEYQAVINDYRSQLYDELYASGDGLVNNPWMKRQLLDGRKL